MRGPSSPVTGRSPLPSRGRRAPAVGAVPRGSGRAGAALSSEVILQGSSSEGGREAGRLRAVPPAVRRRADGCRLPSGRWAGGGEGRPREGRLWARGLPAAVAAAGGTPEWRRVRGERRGCGWGLRLGAASVRGAGRGARAEPYDSSLRLWEDAKPRRVGKSVGVRRGYRERSRGAAVLREGSCERCPVGRRAAEGC